MSSAPEFSLPDKARRRSSSCHRRTDSGELDVFEAERYFSASSESLPQKIGTMSTRQLGSWRQGRASLDMPMMMRHTPQPQEILLDTINTPIDKKKHKQPSSPGGKLASFFNSLINQTVSKKKKPSSKTKSVKDMVDDQDSPGGWRRRRRSSISHMSPSTTTTRSTSKTTTESEVDAKSIKSCNSSLASGFRTPPPYMINLPIKPYKELKAASSPSEKQYYSAPKVISEKRMNWVERINPEAAKESRDFRRFMEEDGAESDSSSDLFELQLNQQHKLGYCASDLPVYESTHMDAVKISSGTPITINGPFRN